MQAYPKGIQCQRQELAVAGDGLDTYLILESDFIVQECLLELVSPILDLEGFRIVGNSSFKQYMSEPDEVHHIEDTGLTIDLFLAILVAFSLLGGWRRAFLARANIVVTLCLCLCHAVIL